MALSLDIAPTLLEAAGLQPGAEIQGRSLVPVLKKEAREWRTSFLIEYFSHTVYPRIRNMGYLATRTARHKHINYRELQGIDELYDLDKDPYEETNIINRSDARETLQQMEAELQRLLDQTRYAAPLTASTLRPPGDCQFSTAYGPHRSSLTAQRLRTKRQQKHSVPRAAAAYAGGAALRSTPLPGSGNRAQRFIAASSFRAIRDVRVISCSACRDGHPPIQGLLAAEVQITSGGRFPGVRSGRRWPAYAAAEKRR